METKKQREERHALGVLEPHVLCECKACGARVTSQVNRYGWGDACPCGQGDLLQVGRRG